MGLRHGTAGEGARPHKVGETDRRIREAGRPGGRRSSSLFDPLDLLGDAFPGKGQGILGG